jgi:hypothetical protein
MKRMSQIVVLVLAISSLLAPASLQCTPLPQPDHSCCASQAQLSAPSCCQPGTASKSAIPAQATGQPSGELVLSPLPVSCGAAQQPVLLYSHSSLPPPILLPATILRT